MAGDPTYKPSTIHLGSGRLSPSMLATWATCRHEFFLHYLAPSPRAPHTTAGLDLPNEPEARWLGSMVHQGLYHLRKSGWVDGIDTHNYDLHIADDKMREWGFQHCEELAFPEQANELMGTASGLLSGYNDALQYVEALQGSVAANPIDGTPMLEMELEIPLLGGRYTLAAKLDMCSLRLGEHWYNEYKTCHVRGRSDWVKGADLSCQGLIGAACLLYNYPTLNIGGTQFELLIKDRGRTSRLPEVEPIPTVLNRRALDLCLQHCERWAAEIDWACTEWFNLVAKGEDPWAAGQVVFPMGGKLASPPRCIRFGNECDYAAWCRNPDMEPRTVFGGFKARTIIERT